MHAAMLRDQFRRRARDIVAPGDVEADREGLVPGFRDRRHHAAELGLVAARNHDGRPRLGERDRAGLADAAAAAENPGDFSIEHFLSPYVSGRGSGIAPPPAVAPASTG